MSEAAQGASESSPPPPPGNRAVLVRLVAPPPVRRIGARVLTKELAEQFAEELRGDITHSVESAAWAVGIKSSTIRMAIKRANDDTCRTLDDEEICEIILGAKVEHVRQLREGLLRSAASKNMPGVTAFQRQLENQAPLEHPRGTALGVEDMGNGNGGALGGSTALRYVVHVPEDEAEEQD